MDAVSATRSRHCRRGRDPPRRARRAAPSGRTSATSATASPRCPPDRWSDRRLLRPRPDRARQDLQQDRRLGARLPVRLEALPHPAEGGGRDGRRASSGRSPIAAEALADYGYPDRPLDPERTGVILGTAMGGELHYLTDLRVIFPEYARAPAVRRRLPAAAPAAQPRASLERWHSEMRPALPPITEDTMPGELANIIAGPRRQRAQPARPQLHHRRRVRLQPSPRSTRPCELLDRATRCDAVLTGGVDRNMGASTFVKFCKIGALSATGTPPLRRRAPTASSWARARALFLLKRLADAERDGDQIYAVIRGVGGSQRRQGQGHHRAQPGRAAVCAIQRAWRERRARPGHRDAGRGARHQHPGRRRGRGREPGARSSAAQPRGSIAPRLGQEQHRPPEGGRRRGRAAQGGLWRCTTRCCRRPSTPSRPIPTSTSPRRPSTCNHELREWPGRPAQDSAPARASAPTASAAPTSTSCWRSTCPACSRRAASRYSGIRLPAYRQRSAAGRTLRLAAAARPRPRARQPGAAVRGILALGAADACRAEGTTATRLLQARRGRLDAAAGAARPAELSSAASAW